MAEEKIQWVSPRVKRWLVTFTVVFALGVGGAVAIAATASTDEGQQRYAGCAAEVDRQGRFKNSKAAPGYVNDMLDSQRLTVIGKCMEGLEQQGY